MRKPTFYYKCENEVADQVRGNCAAYQRLCFRYRDSTSVLYPRRQVFSRHVSYSIIILSNPFKRAYQLAANVWGWEGLVGLRQFID